AAAPGAAVRRVVVPELRRGLRRFQGARARAGRSGRGAAVGRGGYAYGDGDVVERLAGDARGPRVPAGPRSPQRVPREPGLGGGAAGGCGTRGRRGPDPARA